MARRHHRPVPQPGAALTSLEIALHHAELALRRPLIPETIALLVDEAYRPGICLIIEGGTPGHEIVDLADTLAEVALSNGLCRVIVVSSRPERGVTAADVKCWPQLDHRLATAGVELLEWIVCNQHSRAVVSALAGERARWPAPPG